MTNGMTITVIVKRTGKVVAVYTVAPQTCLEAVQRLKEVYPRHYIRLALSKHIVATAQYGRHYTLTNIYERGMA